MPSTKKRKLSDLNPADAGIIITAMEVFLSLIDEDDDDVPPSLSLLLRSCVQKWKSFRFV